MWAARLYFTESPSNQKTYKMSKLIGVHTTDLIQGYVAYSDIKGVANNRTGHWMEYFKLIGEIQRTEGTKAFITEAGKRKLDMLLSPHSHALLTAYWLNKYNGKKPRK